MDLVRKCFMVVVSLALAGCATTRQPAPQPLAAAPGSGSQVVVPGPAKDRVLWEYRMATSAMRKGDYDEAKRLLDDAITRISNVLGKDASARKARRLFSSESKKNFIGEPYERAMAYYYRGILYWMDGEPDNARACFRSAALEDSDTVDKKYASDYVLLDYLDGLATAKLNGDGSDAYKRAATSAKISAPQPYDKDANVLFFIDFGSGPTKYAVGEHAQHLMFRTGGSSVKAVQIQVAGKTYQLRPYDDLYFQATTRGGRVMDHILANKANFKSTTQTAGEVGLVGGGLLAATQRGDAQMVGLGLAAAGLLSMIASSATAAEADTRSWDNLPLYLTFAAIRLPPGEHTAQVDFLDGGNRILAGLGKSVRFTVPTEGDKVLYLNEKSKTTQN